MRYRDWLTRMSHRVRGHGRPAWQSANQFCAAYLCSCGKYVWKSFY